MVMQFSLQILESYKGKDGTERSISGVLRFPHPNRGCGTNTFEIIFVCVSKFSH